MIGRIVEIAGDARYLSIERGFLIVSHKGHELGRTPIDDIAALIGNAHGLIYSNNLLVALAERAIPFVLCGANHRPAGLLWPIGTHHREAARMDAQLRATTPQRKRLWKRLVQAKIGMQAAVLALFGLPPLALRRMMGKVRSGDPSNIEGQAARLYWMLLFGKEFRRDREAAGINAMLNYGYTVLRALVARQLMAAGLHPGISLHHANEGNPMRLVDDLMEPFRPLIDASVRRLVDDARTELDADVRRELALIGARSLQTDRGISPVTIVVQRLAVSLAQAFEQPKLPLQLPPTTSTTLAALWDQADADEHAQEEA
ncbi:MAG: type II CRISPR-associated endonuclease Cas1 [Dokdonella sp.]|nr:MAG: type II CRISPR-associated endonuclease Cas1 [Dokdonella sp.]